ncbi:MAG: SPOR domain-containing protein [bacterium]|nr:SPOR domain-containing protein [bacterium]
MNNLNENNPGQLPVFVAGLGTGNISFSDDGTFWETAAQLISEGQLSQHVDTAMSGKSSPRVWLFLHEPGEAQLSAIAALSVAQELASRDQAVLLLDGDDEQADLSHWAGRKDADGWIDLIRYGSSVLNCGDPIPFEGRRGYLLGVGSFTPADATGPEISDLLKRLKRQADDILITAPANAVGRLWSVEANIRLLCWDRSARSNGLIENLLENFNSADIPVTGLVGFGLPQEKSEPEAVVSEEAPENSIRDKKLDEVLNEAGSDATPGSAKTILDELDEEMDQHDQEFDAEEEEFARRKGNSGIFWIAAVVSVVMISVAATYYFKYVKVPADGHFPVVAENTSNHLSQGSAPISEAGMAQFDSGFVDSENIEETNSELVEVAGGLDKESVEPSNETALVDLENDAADEKSNLQSTDEKGTEEQIDDQQDSEPQEIVPEATADTTAENEPEFKVIDKELERPVDTKAGFGMEPYVEPVGSEGWALHVYSFPDSIRAEKEMSILASKGFNSESRAIQLKDNGRWFRIYVGSFTSRSEANAARKELMKKLGEDWANPVRF